MPLACDSIKDRASPSPDSRASVAMDGNPAQHPQGIANGPMGSQPGVTLLPALLQSHPSDKQAEGEV